MLFLYILNGRKINLGYYTAETCNGNIDNCLQIMAEYYIDEPNDTILVKEFTDPRYPGMENTYCFQFDPNDSFSLLCAIRIGEFQTVPIFNHRGNYNYSIGPQEIPEYCDWYELINFIIL